VDRAGDAVINKVVTNVVYGEDPFANFDDLGRTFLVTETLAVAQFGIGELGHGSANWEGSVGHLLLHGGVGCVALEALDGDCAAGFFAGAGSSLLAGSNLTDAQKLELAPLVGAIAAFPFANGEAVNVSFGATVAVSGILNNYLTHAEAVRLDACIESQDRSCIDELQAKSSQRIGDLRSCEGVSSSQCVGVRSELRRAVAEYLELEGGGFSIFGSPQYFAHDAMVTYGHLGQGPEDPELSTEGYTSEAAIRVLTESRASNEDIVRFQVAAAGTQIAAQEGAGGFSAFVPDWARALFTRRALALGSQSTGRIATRSEVTSHFEEGRRFWTNDPIEFNGNRVFQRDDLFDASRVSTWTDNGVEITGTNLERMATGRAPIATDGNPLPLHHMTQSQNGAIAEVTQTFHTTNYGTIHINTGSLPSGISRSQFRTWREGYWRNRAATYGD
jgi:hypothetical protein